MNKTAMVKLLGVHDARGALFGVRVESSLTERECVDASAASALACLATSLELLSRSACKRRVMVHVDEAILELVCGDYTRMLGQLDRESSRRLFISVQPRCGGTSACAAEFAALAQRQIGVGIMTWVSGGGEAELDSVIFSMAPGIVGVHRSLTERCRARGTRAAILDTLEAATRHGSLVLVDGLDTAADRDWMFEAGVHLGSGVALSRPSLLAVADQYQQPLFLRSTAKQWLAA